MKFTIIKSLLYVSILTLGLFFVSSANAMPNETCTLLESFQHNNESQLDSETVFRIESNLAGILIGKNDCFYSQHKFYELSPMVCLAINLSTILVKHLILEKEAILLLCSICFGFKIARSKNFSSSSFVVKKVVIYCFIVGIIYGAANVPARETSLKFSNFLDILIMKMYLWKVYI